MEAHVYQCPCCGSNLQYDGKSGEMKCSSCDNTFPVDAIQELEEADRIEETAPVSEWDMGQSFEDGAENGLRAYRCPSCGSRMVVSETEAATSCPYCENPSVLPGVLKGAFRPEGIIPFKKTKEDAKEAFKKLCKGKKLLPGGFASQARMEKISGIYVPFWLFDCDADADMTYRATKVHTRHQGDWEITRTEHYHVRRAGEFRFQKVPVNSSTKLDDTLMEAVEPFDAQDETAFAAAYLSGSQAERYDEDKDTCVLRANKRIQTSVEQACRTSVMGYSSVTPVRSHVNMRHGKARNVMMPVWLLNTVYKGKTYTFCMNGQTGRIVGNLPVDMKKAVIWAAGLFVGIGAAAFGMLQLLL